MDPQPGPSFLIRRELNQARLSLIEYEEEPSQEESLVSNNGPRTVQPGDLIIPGWEPPINPPPSSLPDEPLDPLGAIWNVLALIVSPLLFLVVSPLLLASYIFLGVVPRYLVQGALKCCFGRRVQLLPISRVFGSTKDSHHTVMLACRGRCDIEKIREHVIAIIGATDPTSGETKFAHLLQRVSTRLGYLCLESRGTRFDIKNHVKHFDIRSKNLTVDSEDVIPYLESTHNEPFENATTQPQWEILVIPKYAHRPADRALLTESDQQKRLYALIFRFHHGIMNWNMFQQLLVEYIGRTGGRVCSIFCPPSGVQGSRSWSTWEKIQIYFALPFVGPRNFLKKLFTRPRRFADMMKQCPEKLSFAMTRPINTETIEDIKDRTYTTDDTILASCVRIALRNMVMGQNLKLPSEVEATRVFNTTSCILPGIDSFAARYQKYRSCLERLHGSFHAVEKGQVRRGAVRLFNKGLMMFTAVFPDFVSAWMYRTLMKSDVVIQIWPGADELCKIFGGDVVTDIFGWSGIHGIDSDFNVTVTTYCGRVRVNVTGKLGILSESHTDAHAIAREFEEEYKMLAATAGMYPNRLFVPPTVDEANGMFT